MTTRAGHISGMKRLIGVVSVATVAALAACDFAQPTGDIEVCFNRSSLGPDEGASEFERDADESGLRPVVDGDPAVAAPGGEDCAGSDAHVELVSASGEHLWLGITATNKDGLPMVFADAFAGLGDDVHLRLHEVTIWSSSTTVSVDSGGRPIIALQSGAGLAGYTGAVQVAQGGYSGPPALNGCGTEQMLSVNFTDDDGVHSLWNEHNRILNIDGRQLVATNIFSADYVATNCEDTPTGQHFTWLVAPPELP